MYINLLATIQSLTRPIAAFYTIITRNEREKIIRCTFNNDAPMVAQLLRYNIDTNTKNEALMLAAT